MCTRSSIEGIVARLLLIVMMYNRYIVREPAPRTCGLSTKALNQTLGDASTEITNWFAQTGHRQTNAAPLRYRLYVKCCVNVEVIVNIEYGLV